MNMARAGVVEHPKEWEFCGYNEIQNPKKRKGIIDFVQLMKLLDFDNYDDLKDAHYKWVNSEIQSETDVSIKENKWTQSIAVGSKTFIEKIKETLGFRAIGRKVVGDKDTFELREGQIPYGEPDVLYSENTFLWDQTSSFLTSQFSYKN